MSTNYPGYKEVYSYTYSGPIQLNLYNEGSYSGTYKNITISNPELKRKESLNELNQLIVSLVLPLFPKLDDDGIRYTNDMITSLVSEENIEKMIRRNYFILTPTVIRSIFYDAIFELSNENNYGVFDISATYLSKEHEAPESQQDMLIKLNYFFLDIARKISRKMARKTGFTEWAYFK